jgi:hypothetical protein
MKKFTTSIERFLSQQFPYFFLTFIQKPRNHFRFTKERQLSKGVLLSKSDHPSILFFTTQKCASRFVDSVFTQLTGAASIVHADYDAYVTMVQKPRNERVFANDINMQKAFHARGYYYGPIGTYRSIPDMPRYRVVLQLRDPRDVLTSLYFSTAFSHAVINPKLVRRRQEALSMDIDTFVLHEADEYLPIFRQYCDSLLDKSWAVFLKYEEMVTDFPSWLNKLSHHTGLAGETSTLEAVRRTADFSINSEDKYAQRRQITPGDYLRKLQPGTIEQLNGRFAQILDRLGYV